MQTAEQMANAVLLKEMLKSAMPKWDPNVSGMLMGGALGGLGGAAAGYLSSDKEKKNTLRNMLLGGGLGAAALGGIGSMQDVKPAADVEGSFLGDMASRAVSSVQNEPGSAAWSATLPFAGHGTGGFIAGQLARNRDETVDKFIKNLVSQNAQGNSSLGLGFKNKALGNAVQKVVNMFGSSGDSRSQAFAKSIDSPASLIAPDADGVTPRADLKRAISTMRAGLPNPSRYNFATMQPMPYTAQEAEAALRQALGPQADSTLDAARKTYLGENQAGPVLNKLKGAKAPPTGAVSAAKGIGSKVGGGIGLMAMLANLMLKKPDVNNQ
jgi:hypothetical protein